jgi:putative ABC transport system permease protein
MHNFLKDIRIGVRGLIKRPSFAAVAIITLALSIGANTSIFSVVNAVLLRALPFQNPHQLVSVSLSDSRKDLQGLAAYEYLAWKEKSTTFADLAAYSHDNFNLTGQGEPERISCAQATASLFTTLGVQPLRGRWFLAEEDRPGQNQVAIVSEGFWQHRMGRDESVIGKNLTLDNKQYTIVGIMPGNFRFPGDFEIWVPLALDPVRETQGNMFSLVEVVGRLKGSATTQQAQAELDVIARQAAAQMKEVPPSSPQVTPLHEQLVAGVRRTVLVLWGAVALVMMLSCANIANLMLSRTIARQREMAVRAAVGASRWRLIRQLLTEALVLGTAGGALGIVVAIWCTGAITSLVPIGFTSSVYDLHAIGLDWQVFGFSLGLSVLTSIVFGLAPALWASRTDLVKSLRDAGSSDVMSFGFRSLRGWLVVGELALAMVLLLSAGLLTRSFKHLSAINLGFDRENVLTARIGLPQSRYASDEQTVAFHKKLMERLEALPGVQSVGTINHTPLSGFDIIVFMGIEGQPQPDSKKDKPVGIGCVSRDYFRTLKIPLLSGRFYDDHDTGETSKVAIVNQAFASKYFPAGDVLGKRVGFGCEKGPCRTIVGVVGNVKQEGLTEEEAPEVYVPFSQMPFNGMTVFVRTTSDPLSLARSLRNEVFSIDKEQPIYDVKTLDQRVAETTNVSRSLMLLFSGLALLALVLALVGVYGIVSYSVSQRSREIGIRIALGAQSRDVLTLILKNGMALAVSGVAIGLIGAFSLTRFLTALLYGVTPTDRFTFVAISLSLLGIALIASLIPARRATKVDPLVALRCE